ARCFGEPLRGVVDDGAQAAALRLQLFDEGQDAGLVTEVCLQGDGAALTQAHDAVALLAVADDHRLAFVEQTFGAVQPDPLAGTGDQDGKAGSAHMRPVQTKERPASYRLGIPDQWQAAFTRPWVKLYQSRRLYKHVCHVVLLSGSVLKPIHLSFKGFSRF